MFIEMSKSCQQCCWPTPVSRFSARQMAHSPETCHILVHAFRAQRCAQMGDPTKGIEKYAIETTGSQGTMLNTMELQMTLG